MAAPLASQNPAVNTRSIEAELQKLLPQVAQLVNGNGNPAMRGKLMNELKSLKDQVEQFADPAGATAAAPTAAASSTAAPANSTKPLLNLFSKDTFSMMTPPMVALM